MVGWGNTTAGLPRWWTPGIIITTDCSNITYLEVIQKNILPIYFMIPINNEGSNYFFSSRNSYWNDLKSNVFVKITFHLRHF